MQKCAPFRMKGGEASRPAAHARAPHEARRYIPLDLDSPHSPFPTSAPAVRGAPGRQDSSYSTSRSSSRGSSTSSSRSWLRSSRCAPPVRRGRGFVLVSLTCPPRVQADAMRSKSPHVGPVADPLYGRGHERARGALPGGEAAEGARGGVPGEGGMSHAGWAEARSRAPPGIQYRRITETEGTEKNCSRLCRRSQWRGSTRRWWQRRRKRRQQRAPGRPARHQRRQPASNGGTANNAPGGSCILPCVMSMSAGRVAASCSRTSSSPSGCGLLMADGGGGPPAGAARGRRRQQCRSSRACVRAAYIFLVVFC